MTMAREEIFGPVVSFIDYHDDADLIAKVNASDFGLHGTVYSEDPERAYRIARRVRSGSHCINGMWVDIEMPFGGFKTPVSAAKVVSKACTRFLKPGPFISARTSIDTTTRPPHKRSLRSVGHLCQPRSTFSSQQSHSRQSLPNSALRKTAP